jgi:hypothetical protein
VAYEGHLGNTFSRLEALPSDLALVKLEHLLRQHSFLECPAMAAKCPSVDSIHAKLVPDLELPARIAREIDDDVPGQCVLGRSAAK